MKAKNRYFDYLKPHVSLKMSHDYLINRERCKIFYNNMKLIKLHGDNYE